MCAKEGASISEVSELSPEARKKERGTNRVPDSGGWRTGVRKRHGRRWRAEWQRKSLSAVSDVQGGMYDMVSVSVVGLFHTHMRAEHDAPSSLCIFISATSQWEFSPNWDVLSL